MSAERIHNLIRSIRFAAAPGGATSVPDSELLERYAGTRDESAFELLAWRHGAMVLGVCRRVLGNAHDAEDAFQATFLILAKQAASVARFRTVGGWLHTVAYRVSLRARARRSTRNARELPIEDPASTTLDPAEAAAQSEVREAIDAEVTRLPEKYRVPFVMHHLEGRSCADVARELGSPVGTVESWLARARARLRTGLTRRGLAPAPGLLVALVPQGEWLPLSSASVRAALGAAAGTPGAVSPEAMILANEMLKTFFVAKIKVAAAAVLLLAVGTLGMAGVATAVLSHNAQPAPVAAGNEDDDFRPVVRTTFQADKEGLNALALAPDGAFVATVGSDAKVKRWDATTGQERPAPRVMRPLVKVQGQRAEPPVLCVAYSPDGKTVAAAGADKIIRLLDATTGAPKPGLTGHTLVVQALAYSPDGTILATAAGSQDDKAAADQPEVSADRGELKLWNVATGKEIVTLLRNHPGHVTCVAFSPDGKTLLSAGHDGLVRLWDLEANKERAALRADVGFVEALAFSPDGKTFATAGSEGVKLWDFGGQRVRLRLVGQKGSAASLAFSPDGKTLTAAVRVPHAEQEPTGEIRAWDTATGLARGTPLAVAFVPSAVAFSQSGGVMAAGGSSPEKGGQLTVWDTAPRRDKTP